MRLVILGPTGAGKTEVSYDIATLFSGEIISADSSQVYKYLNIGTNKEIFPDIKTHLVDIINPNEIYNTHRFIKDSTKIITSAEKEQKNIILTGGTNFYIKSLIYSMNFGKIDKKKESEYSTLNKDELQKILKDKDKEFYLSLNNSDKNNRRRLLRYISLDTLNKDRKEIFDNRYTLLEIKTNTYDLIKKIEDRTHKMIDLGILDEIEYVFSLGYSINDPGLQIIGYRECIDYIQGKIKNKKELEEEINHSTRKLIKKQYTFLYKIKNKVSLNKEDIIPFIQKKNLTSK